MSRYTSTTKSSSLLQDNSWIKKNVDEDEDIDRDPNFGRAVLSRSQYRSNENLVGSDADKVNSTSTSVQALTKRFSSSQDELRDRTTTTTVTKDGTTETITTRSTVVGSPTQTFTERVKSSSKGTKYSTYSPTRTTKVTETTVSSKDSEDNFYKPLDDFSLADSNTVETVTVRSSADGDTVTTTTTTRTSSMAEDDLYDTLLPKSITSPVSTSIRKREVVSVESSRVESPTLIIESSPSFTRRTGSYSSYTEEIPSTRTTSYSISSLPGDDYSSSEHTSYSYTRPDSSYEYSGTSSPSTYRKSYKSSRSDGILSESPFSRSSVKSVYVSSERTLLDKELCSYCRKPFTGDAKMVLDDMKINCHATCLKCEVCNGTLGHMKAGDCLWIYKRMVHCENCFDVTREKWRR